MGWLGTGADKGEGVFGWMYECVSDSVKESMCASVSAHLRVHVCKCLCVCTCVFVFCVCLGGGGGVGGACMRACVRVCARAHVCVCVRL